jgi:hypothetical protein
LTRDAFAFAFTACTLASLAVEGPDNYHDCLTELQWRALPENGDASVESNKMETTVHLFVFSTWINCKH